MRKVLQKSDSSSSSESDFNSDDSIKDQDYAKLSCDSKTSEQSDILISLNIMWLTPF